MGKRKIIAVTGARSEYDLLFSVYKKLQEDSRFDFRIIVTGPHLSERFGFTAKHVVADGFIIEDEIFNLVDSNKKIGRVISIGNQIPGLAQSFYRCKPDLILVAGDREEAISTTLTAAYMDIPVAHFFGGDIAKDGNIDNGVRYASSKLAHIHFPSLEAHKETLVRLGEDEWRIFVIGNPALDRFVNTRELTPAALAQALRIDALPDEYFVLIQHSIITEVEKQGEYIRETLDAIVNSGVFCFINYPNSGPGDGAIIGEYQEYAAKYSSQFRLFQNLDREVYINLLRKAKCLLGNSSSGLLEAPSLGLPAINIGSRQRGRVHGENVIFVDNDKDEILSAIRKATSDQSFLERVKLRKNPYGDGNSATKVIEILANIELNDRLIHKDITY